MNLHIFFPLRFSVQFGSKNDMSSGASAVTATGQLIPWVKTGKVKTCPTTLPVAFHVVPLVMISFTISLLYRQYFFLGAEIDSWVVISLYPLLSLVLVQNSFSLFFFFLNERNSSSTKHLDNSLHVKGISRNYRFTKKLV